MRLSPILPVALLLAVCTAIPTQAQLVPRNPGPPILYPKVDLQRSVFSRDGSWLIAVQGGADSGGRVVLKTLRWRADAPKWYDRWTSDCYELVVTKAGQSLPYRIEGEAAQVTLVTDAGRARFAFLDNDTFEFEADPGLSLHLVCRQRNSWHYRSPSGLETASAANTQFLHFVKAAPGTDVRLSPGTARIDSGATDEFIASAVQGGARVALRIKESDVDFDEVLPPLDTLVVSEQSDIDAWMAKLPRVPDTLRGAAATAWFQLHSFQVAPAGLITRHALLSSKATWPTRIWAWDHCFHGFALALGDADLGWSQIAVLFDNQMENGCLPDPISDARGDSNFVKPPIHGWAVREMIRLTGPEKSAPWIKQLYAPLARWTEYWMHFRDPDRNGLAHYRHGNDSGWDNATVYAAGVPTEGPDLAAYLILQMDVLGDMAATLDKPAESAEWKRRSQAMLDAMLGRLVVNDRFVTRAEGTGEVAPGRCLINYMPLMLGKRLPEPIRRALVNDLRDGRGFLAPNGFASENLESPLYQPDGYWRGPIWAPPTYQLYRALVEIGETDLARESARRYTAMCARDAAFWENSDAVSGLGLQAPAVQWTTSVFTLLAHELAQ